MTTANDPAILAQAVGVDLEAAQRPEEPEAGVSVPTGASAAPVHLHDPETVTRRVACAVQKVADAKPGNGNNTLNWAARPAGALHAGHPEEVNAEAVRGELIESYTGRDHDQRKRSAKRREGLATVQSGWKSGVRDAAEILAADASDVTADIVAAGEVGPVETVYNSEAGASVFTDLSAVLSGKLGAARPDSGPVLTDGTQRLYAGKVNGVFGDPESAKSLYALTVLADALLAGGGAVFIDTDHNGPELVLRFLRCLDVPDQAILERLRYAEPDDRGELLAVVDAVAALDPCPVVFDSMGENLSLWGVSPNDDQGFIEMNRATAARLARQGHTVITIDHLAKNSDSRGYGATGTTAKKRAVDGALYEATVKDEFSPATGGRSVMKLVKDRNGGVRALGVRRKGVAFSFELSAPDADGRQTWIMMPGDLEPTADEKAAWQVAADVLYLDQLDPPPRSKRDVQGRTGWGADRAMEALRQWRSQQEQEGAA